MRTVSISFCIIFSLFLVTLTAKKSFCQTLLNQETQRLPFFGTYTVQKATLSNGLTILMVEDHSSPTFAYQTWYKVGSKNEKIGKTGLAHLFEHMMFKGTKNLKPGEFDQLLDMAGAEGENAFTSHDYTAYIQELPSHQLELIARLESERMTQLMINAESLKTEIEVVQNERRYRQENNLNGLMSQALFELAFEHHAYRWPIIGYEKDLNSTKVEDAVQFYQKFYHPKNATVVIVGSIDPKKTLLTLKKYYQSISSPSFLSQQKIASANINFDHSLPRPKEKTLFLNTEIEKIQLAYIVPPLTHPHFTALNVLHYLLTGGKSSRLYQTLINTSEASSVKAYLFENEDPTLFVIKADLQKNKKSKTIEPLILKELEKIKQKGPSQEELNRVKNKIKHEFYKSLEDNYGKALFLGHYQTLAHDFSFGLKENERVQTITPQQVQQVVETYFQPEKRVTILGIKK